MFKSKPMGAHSESIFLLSMSKLEELRMSPTRFLENSPKLAHLPKKESLKPERARV